MFLLLPPKSWDHKLLPPALFLQCWAWTQSTASNWAPAGPSLCSDGLWISNLVHLQYHNWEWFWLICIGRDQVINPVGGLSCFIPLINSKQLGKSDLRIRKRRWSVGGGGLMPPDATPCCLCSPLVLSGAMLETDGQATEGGKQLNITTVESHRADDTQCPQPQAQSWRWGTSVSDSRVHCSWVISSSCLSKWRLFCALPSPPLSCFGLVVFCFFVFFNVSFIKYTFFLSPSNSCCVYFSAFLQIIVYLCACTEF